MLCLSLNKRLEKTDVKKNEVFGASLSAEVVKIVRKTTGYESG